MKKIAYELYNPYLTIGENAQKLGCSVSALKKYFKIKGIDRKFDRHFVYWRKIKDFYENNPSTSLKQGSEKIGCSINTIRKYKSLSEDELCELKRDTEKVSSFDIKNRNAIKTISYDQSEILAWIMKLYNNSESFDCDLTASKCIFWKSLPQPLHLYDKYPQLEHVKPRSEADALNDESFNSIVYDLPFIVSSGAIGMIRQRFTHFESIEELFNVNDEMLIRAYRLLRNKGLLVIKTMDCAYGNRQIWVSDYVIRKAEDIGLELIDKFILLSDLRLFPRTHQQRVARKYHSYFLVFKKK